MMYNMGTFTILGGCDLRVIITGNDLMFILCSLLWCTLLWWNNIVSVTFLSFLKFYKEDFAQLL